MADLPQWIPNDDDDVVLGTTPVTNLEQADDILLLSTTARGLQRKMSGLFRWCGRNFMIINSVKSEVMVFGTRSTDMPQFRFGDEVVSVVDAQSYIGFKVSSKPRMLLSRHYDEKAEQARQVGLSICGLEALIGKMPVPHLLKLYQSLVDPHLTHGCEIILDTVANQLQKLERVQLAFLRRVLGVGERSIRVVLFTETGMLPIRIRRLLLAIDCVRYYVRLPRGHLAREAFERGYGTGRDGEGQLGSRLASCDFGAALLDVISGRPVGADKWLHTLLEDNELLYLLHGRKERVGSGEVRVVRRSLRGYLRIGNRDHRVALTKLLVANHTLRSVTGRWAGIPLNERWCRMCGQAEETPEHVLLECRGVAEVITQRQRVRQLLMNVLKPDDMERIRSVGSRGTDQLRILISIDKASVIVAPFAYKVMKTLRQVAS
ncbi:hypothetical protein CC1G_12170 [Coprinopsis cinerea okayama7|uniref:Reverse transcriptase domain-containing protein n=1 Tax=Coprinopsis cinerea (strain Okayama-7 / 130 / ATCC MYA-4618 / FGSC 9003) TaxID=240176 RepID=A8NHL8_COPC7|nr:hypothetical protein CC1G_12170 [Coprinopsis cinerea okayama7\|eukprot:XP_001833788.2 hypothetical protein CC1G_12170 [Coprinopsis cinerea okayama7\